MGRTMTMRTVASSSLDDAATLELILDIQRRQPLSVLIVRACSMPYLLRYKVRTSRMLTLLDKAMSLVSGWSALSIEFGRPSPLQHIQSNILRSNPSGIRMQNQAPQLPTRKSHCGRHGRCQTVMNKFD